MATYEDVLAAMAAARLGGARKPVARKPAAQKPAKGGQPPGLRAYAKFRAAHPGMPQAQLAEKWRAYKSSGRGMMCGVDDIEFLDGGGALIGGKARNGVKARKKMVRGSALVGGKAKMRSLGNEKTSEIDSLINRLEEIKVDLQLAELKKLL